jgi:hypothetical protein
MIVVDICDYPFMPTILHPRLPISIHRLKRKKEKIDKVMNLSSEINCFERV